MDYVSLNGQLTPADAAQISASDAGFLHGAGLFETMRVRHGRIFRAADHLARMTESARELDLNFSLTESQLCDLVQDLLEVNNLIDARVRMTLTRGDLSAISAENPTPDVTLLITAAPFTAYPPELYGKGMSVMISAYKQNLFSPTTGHKTTSYLDRLLALKNAQQNHAGEALWFTPNNDTLAEGSISNIFIVDKEGILVTTPLALPDRPDQRLCLPGITRKVVLELARDMQVLPHERMIRIDDLLAAKEAFITNAIMGIMPVVRVERHIIGDEKPGALTQRLREAYDKLLEAQCGGVSR